MGILGMNQHQKCQRELLKLRFVLVDDPGQGRPEKVEMRLMTRPKPKLARKGDKVCMEVFVPESNRRFPRRGRPSHWKIVNAWEPE